MSVEDLFGDLKQKDQQEEPKPTPEAPTVETAPVETPQEPTPATEPAPPQQTQEVNSLFGEPAPVAPQPASPEPQAAPVPVQSTPVVTPAQQPAPATGQQATDVSIFGAPIEPRKRLKEETELIDYPETYDFKPIEPVRQSKVIMIYGDKGVGKTHLALSLPGKIAALSFDRKTSEVWIESFKADERIRVDDAIKYMNFASEENWLRSSVVTLDYLDKLFDHIKEEFQPDWVLIDGVGEFIRIAEMKMRYVNNLSMTQGVEWSYWKYRRMYIRQLHHKATACAKHGVIYTAYVDFKEKYENGKIVETKEYPKWVDIIEEQTDVVIRVRSRMTDTGNRYIAEVESSKWARIRSGVRVDITTGRDELPNCFARIIEKSEER